MQKRNQKNIIKSQINIFYNKNLFQGIKLNDKSLVLTVSK